MREYTEEDFSRERKLKTPTSKGGPTGPRDASHRTQTVRDLESILRDHPDGKWIVLCEGWPVGWSGADKTHPWSHYATAIRSSWYINDSNPDKAFAAVKNQLRLPAPAGKFQPACVWTEDGMPILRVRVVQPGESRPKYGWQGGKTS